MPRASESTPRRERTASGSAKQSMPSTRADPRVGTTRVAIMRSVVVLPAPLGPRSPVMKPSGAVKLTSRTASTSPKRFARSRVSIKLGPQRQDEERARDALEAFAVERARVAVAHERLDEVRRTAMQAHSVADLRRDEVTRVRKARRNLVAVAWRRRGIDAAREDQDGNFGAHRIVEIRGDLAAGPYRAGANEVIYQRAPKERALQAREIFGRDSGNVRRAHDREMHPDRQVLGNVIGEFEVLREQRIEVAPGRCADSQGQQARELRHVQRAKESREEHVLVHFDGLALAAARILDRGAR